MHGWGTPGAFGVWTGRLKIGSHLRKCVVPPAGFEPATVDPFSAGRPSLPAGARDLLRGVQPRVGPCRPNRARRRARLPVIGPPGVGDVAVPTTSVPYARSVGKKRRGGPAAYATSGAAALGGFPPPPAGGVTWPARPADRRYRRRADLRDAVAGPIAVCSDTAASIGTRPSDPSYVFSNLFFKI
jgi:hypothetical protein